MSEGQVERDDLTEASIRSHRALGAWVRSLNFIQRELKSNGRNKQGSDLLLMSCKNIRCKFLKVYSGCCGECRIGKRSVKGKTGQVFQVNDEGGLGMEGTVEREKRGCIPSERKLMWLGCLQELRIKDGSSSVGKKYAWCPCLCPQS